MSDLVKTVREALEEANVGEKIEFSYQMSDEARRANHDVLRARWNLIEHAPSWLAALCDENERLRKALGFADKLLQESHDAHVQDRREGRVDVTTCQPNTTPNPCGWCADMGRWGAIVANVADAPWHLSDCALSGEETEITEETKCDCGASATKVALQLALRQAVSTLVFVMDAEEMKCKTYDRVADTVERIEAALKGGE